MQEGCFCFLTPSYYIRFTDPYLMMSKEDGGGRPFFFTFRDTLHPHIMWLVPISRADNKMNKYQDVIQRKIRLYGRCDTIVLGTVLGQRAAFLIQNMCPAVEQYIADIYYSSRPICLWRYADRNGSRSNARQNRCGRVSNGKRRLKPARGSP